MLNCEQARDMMSLYIDEQLQGIEFAQFNEHILACEQCKKELDFLQSVVEICNDMEEVELPENFKQQLHEKLVQSKQDTKHNTPPWYLNWRMYSGLAAGILLVILLNSQYFAPFNKYEEAYVKDAAISYESAQSLAQVEQEKDSSYTKSESNIDDNKKLFSDQGSSEMMNDAVAFSVPISEDNTQESVTAAVPNERSFAKEPVREASANKAPEQEPVQKQIGPASEEFTALADEQPVDPGMKVQGIGGQESPSLYENNKEVCCALSNDNKPIISYKVIVKIAKNNSALVWEKIQDKLSEYDGQYNIINKSGIQVIQVSKEVYNELEQYIKSMGMELTIQTIEQDETDNYRNLVDQTNMLSEQIYELEEKLNQAKTQEEKDAIQKQMTALIKQQQSITRDILDLEDSIDKYSIYVETI